MLMERLLQDRGGSHKEDGIPTFSSSCARAHEAAEDTGARTSSMPADMNPLFPSHAPEDKIV